MDWNEISEDIRKVECRTFEKVIDNATEDLRTDLRSLITEDGAWNGFVEAAELSSEEGEALRDALKERLAQDPTDENDRPQREQQKERFLREFPQLKKKLEDHIRKLRDLADKFDQVHKDCTISNVVSTSASAASGVLALLGLVLSPFTAGTSLALSASSVALGATSSVSSFTTTVVEDSMTLSYESEARNLIGASMNVLEEILSIMPKITCKFYNTVADLVKAFKTLKGQIQTIRRARSISRRGAQARNLTSTGRSSGQGVSQMTRGARISAGVFTSVFLGWDVYDLVKQSEDLYDGAKTKSGGALQDLARKLEENLQKFDQKYNALQSDLPQ